MCKATVSASISHRQTRGWINHSRHPLARNKGPESTAARSLIMLPVVNVRHRLLFYISAQAHLAHPPCPLSECAAGHSPTSKFACKTYPKEKSAVGFCKHPLEAAARYNVRFSLHNTSAKVHAALDMLNLQHDPLARNLSHCVMQNQLTRRPHAGTLQA